MGSIHPASWKPGYCLKSMVNMSSLTSKNQEKLGEVCWRLGDWEVYFPVQKGNGRYSHPYRASAGKFSTKRTLDALPSGSPLAASPIIVMLDQVTKTGGGGNTVCGASCCFSATGGGTTCIWDFQKKHVEKHMRQGLSLNPLYWGWSFVGWSSTLQ